MNEEILEILELCEAYLGGFIGSSNEYKQVEELRTKIRQILSEYKDEY